MREKTCTLLQEDRLRIMEDPSGSVLHRETWHDQVMEIIDNGDQRSLYFGSRYLQSSMSLSRPQQLLLSYTRYMLLGLPILDTPEGILIIGIGAGSLTRFCHHHFPACRIDAVDCSSRVIDLARGYFRLPDNEQVRIHCREGLAFLRELPQQSRFDLILVDAFDHQGMSETVYTDPFFESCAAVLTGHGILSCNLWSGDPQRLAGIRSALSRHFPGHLYIPVPNRGNIVALAFRDPVPWTRLRVEKDRLIELEERFGLDFRKMLRVVDRQNRSLLQRVASLFSLARPGGLRQCPLSRLTEEDEPPPSAS